MPFPVRACDLICLEHCNKKIFGTELPECCPVCETNLSQCDLKMPPFKLPSPFARAQDHPCSVVIKPTKGDFLEDYQSRANLHIAATTSKGIVVEYDQHGVHMDRTAQWNRCIVADLASQVDPEIISDPDWGEYWDLCLENCLKSTNWNVEYYDENANNCFTFILDFLKTLKVPPVSSESGNKIQFCEKYILAKTTQASKYICLFRKVRDHGGIFVQDSRIRTPKSEVNSESDSEKQEITLEA